MAVKVTDTEGIERVIPEVSEVGKRISDKVDEESIRAIEAEKVLTDKIDETERVLESEILERPFFVVSKEKPDTFHTLWFESLEV